MVDDGAWGTYEINALQLYAFSSEEFASGTRVGTFNRLAFPWLEEYEETAAPRRSAMAKNNRTILTPFDTNIKVANK
jgi:hypothetical protein